MSDATTLTELRNRSALDVVSQSLLRAFVDNGWRGGSKQWTTAHLRYALRFCLDDSHLDLAYILVSVF